MTVSAPVAAASGAIVEAGESKIPTFCDVAAEHGFDMTALRKRNGTVGSATGQSQRQPMKGAWQDAVPLAAPEKLPMRGRSPFGTEFGAAVPRSANDSIGILSRILGVGPWICKHLLQLRRNGTLLQAVGVPLRHLLAVGGLGMCLRGAVSWRTYLFAFSLWPLSGFGITAGAHRLWTHQSYKPTLFMEALLVILYSIADQGPITGWALTHALHHRSSDTPLDPHNRNAGFWYAHFGWLFSSQSFHVRPEDYSKIVSGLGSPVRQHDRWYPWWDPLWSHIMPMLVASRWGEAWGGLLVAGALRWACVQHVTFFVNSVAHGERDEHDPHAFDGGASGIGPRVSLLVTVLALGEGWHDYHHLFPWDYAAAELGAWHQWNPTKVFIDCCHRLGLCTGLRRCSEELQLARRAQLLQEKQDSARSAAVPKKYKIVGFPFLRTRVPMTEGVEDSTKCNVQGLEGLRG